MRAALVFVVVLSMVGIGAMTLASSPMPFAFERAARERAPRGYVAYTIRLWGIRASGRFTAAELNENGQITLRSENGDDGRIGAPTVDAVVASVVFLPASFEPSKALLALMVQRPAGFRIGPQPPVPLTLRRLGPDPADGTYDLYETQLAGFVLSGTITSFELNDAIVKRGYPYRGPFSFTGPYTVRPAKFPGEKSIIRIPVGASLPEILIQRS